MPDNSDYAATAEYFGWMGAQAYALAHLWAFQLHQAGYDPDAADELFATILRQHDNAPVGASNVTPENLYAMRQHAQSHLEGIFDRALIFLREARGEGPG